MINIKEIINIAQHAGKIILAIYNQPTFSVIQKLDTSPLTQADTLAHEYICKSLHELFPTIPIISEESVEHHDYEIRKNWEYFFLVDPLDGTKEFIERNGEFTVNIALIKKHSPILGVIHVPEQNVTYYAEKNKGAYKILFGDHSKLKPEPKNANVPLRIVTSRSHLCAKTQAFIDSLQHQSRSVTTLSAGSALKFALLAEGKADIYPRFSPTMEWDTAAGQILVNETGKKIHLIDNESELLYNKTELKNSGFIAR